MAVTSPSSAVARDETLLITRGSILNASFFLARTRRPLYTVHTKGSTTKVYRVEGLDFQEMASISWTGISGPSEIAPGVPLLVFYPLERAGIPHAMPESVPLDEWFQTTKSFFG